MATNLPQSPPAEANLCHNFGQRLFRFKPGSNWCYSPPMRYAVAAILMLYAALCLIWPGHVFRAFQGGFSSTVSAGYVRGSAFAIRLLGAALLIGVPALFLLGYAK